MVDLFRQVAYTALLGCTLTVGVGEALAQNAKSQQVSFEYSENSPQAPALPTVVSEQPVTPPVVEGAPIVAACPPKASAKSDAAKKKALAAKVAGAYKGVFYNNDFSYLCDDCYDGYHLGDGLKRRCLGGCVSVDIGGQYRNRYHIERNMRGLGLTGNDDDFDLQRTRLYTNVKIGDGFRAYAEYIDATSSYENFNPRPIEENRSDMLNLFADVRMAKVAGGELWARVGRQELLYGAQRTVTPLDWANTRLTFEGYKLFYKNDNWEIDGFYTNPMIRNPVAFDSPNENQEFMGMYSTYKGNAAGPFDFYYLTYNNLGTFNYDTIGTRHQGGSGNWLWEFEGAYQFGNTGPIAHSAFAYTLGMGRKFPCLPWSPQLWGYFDWAKGGNRNVGSQGYNHLFPLAHKYIGFMDFFGRRNIEDLNFQLTLSPTKRLKLLAWYHILHLQTIDDNPATVAMTPFNPANAPGSSDLGQEIDILARFAVTPRQSIVMGYSHFFAGNYYSTTAGTTKQDADFYYAQYQINF